MRHSFSILFTLIFLVFFQSLAQAADEKSKKNLGLGYCLLPTPALIGNDYSNINSSFIQIESKTAFIDHNEIALFSGGVTLISKDTRVFATEIELNRITESFNANGDIHFQNGGVNIFASDLLVGGADEKKTELSNARYQLSAHPGHGLAQKIEINSEGQLVLLDSTYTTCPQDTPDWQISASKIRLSQLENVGEAFNTTIRIKDVPVLYLPYITFPVNNNRKSGIIDPVLSYSRSAGVVVETPYYWNIAENYDATLTPKYMSKRGLQLQSEFRYLIGEQLGQLNLEYLNKDNALINSDEPRYLARFQHSGTLLDNYRAFADFSYVSDDYYLVDIGSDQFNRSDSYLSQVGEMAYFSELWHVNLRLLDFAVLGTHTNSYKTIPQIEFYGLQPIPFGLANIEVAAEYSHFDTPDKHLPSANRYHVETGLNIPYGTPGWFFNSEFKVLHTTYQQNRLAENSPLDEDVTRTLPKLRFHGGMNFERILTQFSSPMIQTLEPQMQYIYIPFKDQSNIGLYDTTLLQDDYTGLFRERRFSGLDRIAEANLVTWGLTSRLFNLSNEELFHISLGRIFYLNDNRAKTDLTDNLIEDKSALAAELFFQLDKRWQLSGDIQFNTDTDITDKGQVSLDYHHDEKHLFQLNHRYSRDVSGSNIEQMSMLTTFALNKDWQFIGRYTRDLERKRSLDSYIGVQYESCCWAVRIGYKRHINTNLDNFGFIAENRNEFDSGIMLSFVIKGLGGRQQSVGIEDLFSRGIFGYKRPYFLNN